MDINFSAQDLAFRDEVRAFFASEYDAEVAASLSGGQGEDYKKAIVAGRKNSMPKAGLRRAGLKNTAALAGLSPRSLSMRPSVARLVFPMWFPLV